MAAPDDLRAANQHRANRNAASGKTFFRLFNRSSQKRIHAAIQTVLSPADNAASPECLRQKNRGPDPVWTHKPRPTPR